MTDMTAPAPVDVDASWVEFPSSGADGTTAAIRGYLAVPRGLSAVPVVIMAHENLGVTEHRQQVTRAVAAEGIACLTVDLFSRIGGRPPQDFSTQDERREKAFKAAFDEQAIPDLEAGIAYLHTVPEVDARAVVAVGFCLGGGTVLQWATETDLLRAVVVLYGIPILPPEYRPDGVSLSRIEVAAAIRVPLQAHFGGADQAIPRKQVDDLAAALQHAEQPVDFNIYEGAGHAYHDDTHPNYDAMAADQTWTRMMAFLRDRLT